MAGRETKKVVPSPGCDSSQICRCCRSIDALRNCQAEPFTLRFLRVEPMKKVEDFWLMIRGDADAVVLHGVDRSASLRGGP